MAKVYGYIRISTAKQDPQRQVKNIMAVHPDAELITEVFTGSKLERPKFQCLLKKVEENDTIIFDEISRMSRNAKEGFELYQNLFQKGINLEFIKEPHLNTATYKETLANGVPMTGTDVDILLEAVNRYILKLAERQIQLAFDRAEQEITYLHTRTKEGMKASGAGEKISASRTGKTYETAKAVEAKRIIKQKSMRFSGSMNDSDVAKLAGISRVSFYRYVKQMEEQNEE